MISCIKGYNGAGKSYEAVVSHIIPAVRDKSRKVVTNIPLDIEWFKAHVSPDSEELIDVVQGEFHNYGGERPFSKKEHFLQYQDWQNDKGQKAMFVIDEAHLAYPTGECDKQVVEFFTMHRHYGFDIMFLSSMFSGMARNVKQLISNQIVVTKLSALGFSKKYKIRTYSGFKEHRNPKDALSDKVRSYNPKYYGSYSSHTKSDKAVDEDTLSDIGNFFKKKTFIIAALLLVATIVLLIKFGNPADLNNTVSGSVSSSPSKEVPTSHQLKTKPVSQSTSSFHTLASDNYHPYNKLRFHISGWSEFSEYGKRVKEFYFDATKSGKYLFRLKLSELRMAGYDVYVVNNCLIKLAFDTYTDYVTCDSPGENSDSTTTLLSGLTE